MTKLYPCLFPFHLVVVLVVLLFTQVESSHEIALKQKLSIRKESNTSFFPQPLGRKLPFRHFKKTQEKSDEISLPVHLPLSLTLVSMLPRKGADLILSKGKGLLKSKKLLTKTSVVSCLICHHLLTHPRASHAMDTDGDNYNAHAKKMSLRQVVTRAGRFWWKVGPIIAHYKFTQTWVEVRRKETIFSSGLSRQRVDEIYEELHDKYATAGLDIILEMRGLFIKIGQVLSSRPDFIPKQFIDCFGSLQDDVPPWDSKEIKQLVVDSLKLHHGLEQFEEIFCDFEDDPVGSASIGQVSNLKVNQVRNLSTNSV